MPPVQADDASTKPEESSPLLGAPLAHQQDSAPVPITPVILGGPDEAPVVYGVEKKRLTFPRYNIIKALLEAVRNLSKNELDKRSGHTDARKLLKKMVQEDGDWARAIIMPQGPGTGYGIRK
jgi:hypothetical protein